MNYKANIGEGAAFDVEAADFDEAVVTTRGLANGDAFWVQTVDGHTFHGEPTAARMAELDEEIANGLCPACCYRMVIDGLDLCRKCITY